MRATPDRTFATEEFLAALDQPVVVLDEQGVVLYANPASTRLLGRDEELHGALFGSVETSGPSITRVDAVSQGDGGNELVEYELRSFPTVWKGESALVVLLRDLADYRDRADQARSALRRRDDFLAMLSHELRNPMAAISGASHVLGKSVDRGSERVETSLDVLRRQSRVLVRLVDDLLDLSRVSRGKLDLSREPLDLVKLVEDQVHAFRAAESVEVDVEVVRGSSEVRVDGDRVRLSQVLQNLLRNAVKHGAPPLSVWVGVDESGAGTLMVDDAGEGIDPKDLELVFEPFEQTARETRTQSGLGLGLALVKQLVELHQGTVRASNREGGGARFVVRLPTCDQTPKLSNPEIEVFCEPRTVLLVDDEPDIRSLMTLLLEDRGWTVREFGLPQEALDAIRAGYRPEAALLDITTPGMNGWTLARRIREELGDASPRMVALSGHGQPQDRAASKQAGMAAHLVKPVEIDEVVRALAGAEE